MGLKPLHLRDRVVRPALSRIGLWTLAAEQLVMGTAAQESLGFTCLEQLGGGPALGLWQMEPATASDIWENYLAYKPELRQLVAGLLGIWPERHLALATNLAYGAAMCRVHYYRSKAPLPAAGDVAGMARMWRATYNTALGKGRPEDFVLHYRELVAPLYLQGT